MVTAGFADASTKTAVSPLAGGGGQGGIAVVVGPHGGGQPELLEVAQAIDCLGLRASLAQRGQQHAGQNRDNRDDNKQLNQSERLTNFVGNSSFHGCRLYLGWLVFLGG